MKPILGVIALFTALSAYSQTTAANDAMDAQINQRLMQRPANQNVLVLQPEKANEMRANGVTYSGILVELAKTDNPLQLINPLAPAAYGSSEDNTARDPITHKVSGLKLFSISF